MIKLNFNMEPNHKILDYYTCPKTKECTNQKCWIRQVIEEGKNVILPYPYDTSNMIKNWIYPELKIVGGPPGGISILCKSFEPTNKMDMNYYEEEKIHD